MLSYDRLMTQLQEANLRVTPQRLAIYRALVASNAHPTAHMLFEQLRPTLPSLSQATVYNTLQTLARCGLIHEIGEAGDSAVHYDANLMPHVNLICTQCHSIEDVFGIPLDDIAEQVIARSRFQVSAMSISYFGRCPRCQQQRPPHPKHP